MGFVEGLLNVLTGGALGGIVGVGSAIATKVIDLKLKDKELEARRLDLEHEEKLLPMRQQHELAVREKDLAQAKQEAELKVEQLRVEGDTQLALADFAGIGVSLAHDTAARGTADTWMTRWIVDPMRALTRPMLTIWAALLLAYITVLVLPALKAQITASPGEAWALAGRVVFVAEVIIFWWFGTRPSRANGRGAK